MLTCVVTCFATQCYKFSPRQITHDRTCSILKIGARRKSDRATAKSHRVLDWCRIRLRSIIAKINERRAGMQPRGLCIALNWSLPARYSLSTINNSEFRRIGVWRDIDQLCLRFSNSLHASFKHLSNHFGPTWSKRDAAVLFSRPVTQPPLPQLRCHVSSAAPFIGDFHRYETIGIAQQKAAPDTSLPWGVAISNQSAVHQSNRSLVAASNQIRRLKSRLVVVCFACRDRRFE